MGRTIALERFRQNDLNLRRAGRTDSQRPSLKRTRPRLSPSFSYQSNTCKQLLMVTNLSVVRHQRALKQSHELLMSNRTSVQATPFFKTTPRHLRSQPGALSGPAVKEHTNTNPVPNYCESQVNMWPCQLQQPKAFYSPPTGFGLSLPDRRAASPLTLTLKMDG